MARRRRGHRSGDGSALKPYRWSDVLWRSLLHVDHGGHRYAVHYDYFDWDGRVALYRDGRQSQTAKAPAHLPVPGGRIEFAASLVGVTRAHLVLDGGTEVPLVPDPRSAEAWRKRLAVRHPRLSTAMALSAVLVLIVGLIVAAVTLLEAVTHLPFVEEAIGWGFESPLRLGATWASALGVAGVLAVVERALSMRYHWLLDADTWWID